MWNRATLKGYAKNELKTSYWLSFGVCLVAAIFGVGPGGTTVAGGGGHSSRNLSNSDFPNLDFLMNPAFIAAILFIVAVAVVVSFAFGIFIANPIQVGQSGFFVKAAAGERNFKNLFSAFSGGNYVGIIKTMFLTNLYIFLWSLLFVIPGIIKSYEYRMVPYILAEEPNLSPSEAMRRSSMLTANNKFNIFVLELSFIGWFILGALALGVGTLFVLPYQQATMAQLYLALKQENRAN